MTELTREDLIALRDSGFTESPWRFDRSGTNSRSYALHARIEGQEFGSRETLLVPSYKGIEVDDIWVSVSEPNAKLIEAAPALLAYAIKADERVQELELIVKGVEQLSRAVQASGLEDLKSAMVVLNQEARQALKGAE